MSAALLRSIVAAYRDRSAGRSLYRAARLALAGYADVVARLPTQGLIVDLGAGDGLLAHWLVRTSPGRRVLAVDADPRRVARLATSARGLPIEARVADLRDVEIPPCDAVVLLDVLHYLDRSDQEAVLARAAAALRPGGTLLLRDPDAGAGARFAFNRLHEAIATRTGFTRARVRAFRTGRAWAVALQAAGLADPRVDDLALLSPWADRVVAASVPRSPPPAPSRPAPPWARLAPWEPADAPRCPVCGSWRRGAALRLPDGDIVRCRGCGLLTVARLPDPAAVAAVYGPSYFRGDRGYRDYVAEEGNYAREFRRRLRRLRAAGGRGRLLDVGAASGALVRAARAEGWDAVGIEPCDAMAAVARADGLDVRTARIEDADLPAASFDVVTAFDVVEHLRDPVAGLARLRSWSRGGGLVAVTVPDFGGWWARSSGARWPMLTPWEHLHYFTRRTLCRALLAAGLRPLSIGLANTPLSLGTLLRKAAGRPGALGDRLLGPIAHLGGALPFGTLLAIGAPQARCPR